MADPTPETKAKAKAEPTSIKARVLTECAYGKANDVITLDADEAKASEAQGLIDTNEAAVAYAETLAP